MSEPLTPLIYNPSASGGRGLKIAMRAVGLLAARGFDVALEPTSGPGGASPLAERLARGGARRVLVVGGDGTLSEVADGVLRSGASVELGFIPGGTGNDFLLGLGVRDTEDAVERIASGSLRALDAG
ncbi:MAG: acylglycerol kinase family protein, partial [Candidatus Thermoplasmatota archaeon]